MVLHISDYMTIEEIQERFNECFPLLKLNFYSKPHKKFKGSDNRHLFESHANIGEIRSNHYNGSFEIKSWQTIAQVEKQLKELFGLNTQILRWDKENGWIQTSASDELTLQQQSQIGLEYVKDN